MKKINRTAYFGISKSNRIYFDVEIEVVKKCLKKHEIDLVVFVDKYSFKQDQEKEMMKIAFEEIDKSDLLIVELSKKAIGVGVEVGYAKAKNKPIIYLKKKDAKYSTTVGGSSNYIIEYRDKNDLQSKLVESIHSFSKE